MRALSIRLHRAVAALGGVALVLWGLSGLLHPVMTTWGPQQAVFRPPAAEIDLAGARPLHETLAAAGIAEASAVRVLAGERGPLLQVTQDQHAPRRYFKLDDGAELPDHDKAHAVFLARHYTGTTAPVSDVAFVTEFTADYPWVNRLLPVYRVRFDREDDLSIYVYTETNAAAGVSNRFKSVVETGFRWVHTWSWFPREAGWARVVLIGLLVGSAFAAALSGIAMLVLIRRGTRAPGMRGWHRIAGYALAAPLLMFTASGLYHLLQDVADPPTAALSLSPPIDLRGARFGLTEAWPDIAWGLDVAAVSIVADAEGRHLYRLGLAPDRDEGRSAEPTTPAAIRSARFDGVQPTGPALYLDARTGEAYPGGDRELALQLGERFTGAPRGAIEDARLVTRFGMDYDFRNKRLPVWRLDYGAPVHASVFVDTTTGVLADRVLERQKPERVSFSMLHKWGFLRPLGRDAQNVVISAFTVLLVVFAAGMGLALDLKRRRRRPGGRRPGRRNA